MLDPQGDKGKNWIGSGALGGDQRAKASKGGCQAGRPEAKAEGLCLSCRKRDKCDMPRPEGGLWHCGKYKLAEH